MCKFNNEEARKLALEKSEYNYNLIIEKIKKECEKGYFHIVVPEIEATDAVRVHLRDNGFIVANPNTNGDRRNVTIRWDN